MELQLNWLGAINIYVNGALHYKAVNPIYILKVSEGIPTLILCLGCYLIGIGVLNMYKCSQSNFLFNNTTAFLTAFLIFIALFFPKADILIILLLSLFLLNLSKDSNQIAKLLSSKVIYFLGVVSYSLYLIHYPIALELKSFHQFTSNHFPSTHPFVILFTIYILSSIILATIFTYLFEVPMIKYLNRLLIPKNRNGFSKTLIIEESNVIK